MFSSGKLKIIDDEHKFDYATIFWNAISDTFPKAWNDFQPGETVNGEIFPPLSKYNDEFGMTKVVKKIQYRLTDLVGVAALSKLAGDIISESLGNPNPTEYIKNQVDKLKGVDWKKIDDNPWMNGQAGFAGQRGLYDLLVKKWQDHPLPWE